MQRLTTARATTAGWWGYFRDGTVSNASRWAGNTSAFDRTGAGPLTLVRAARRRARALTKVVSTASGRTGRLYQMSRHFFWLIPITNLAVFLVLGLLLAGFVRVYPRFGRWFALRCLAALVVLPSALLAAPEIHGLVWLVFAWGLAVQLVPVLERRAQGFRRGVAVSFPILVGIVILLAGVIFGSDWVRERAGIGPCAAAARLTERAARHARLGASGSFEPLRLSEANVFRTGTTGKPRRPVRSSAFDLALDAACSRQHVHRAIAS